MSAEPPTPAPRNRPLSVIKAPRRMHSEKPKEVSRLIERMYPRLPRLELFQRKPRKGWMGWGNEVGPPAGSRARGGSRTAL